MLRIASCVFFLVLLAGLLFAGAGEIARLIYPPAMVLLAAWLFVSQRDFYFDLVLWSWFLSPFLRRIMDFEAGWKEPSIVLLTPFLVTLVAPLLGARRISERSAHESAPFILALIAIACGVGFGLFQGPASQMATPLMEWAVPVLFGLWLHSTTDEDRTSVLTSLERSFIGGLLVMGTYGVVQYVLAPPWDTNWLTQLSTDINVNSMGTPEPFGLRVFSTMNSSGVLAVVLALGLLVLVQSHRKLAAVAAIFGSFSLLLTFGRAAWLTLAIGLALLLILMPRNVLRAAAIPALALFMAFSLAALGPARDMIGQRFSTFNRLQDDQSAGDRLSGTIRAGQLLMNQPQGYGLGVPQDFIATDGSFSLFDNGFADGFLALGLLPGLLYFGCLAFLLFQSGRGILHKPPAVRAVAVAAVAAAAQLPLASVFLGATGVLLWTFTSLACRGEYSLPVHEDLVGSAHLPVSKGSPEIPGVL